MMLLFLLHGLSAAAELAVTALGDDHLRSALGALISLPHLIGHAQVTPGQMI